MASNGVVVSGLREFRADVRRAASAYPSEIPKALKAAGLPVVARASQLAPIGPTGNLASGYKVSVRGTTASVVSSVPYSGGAEWGRFGKWSGFNRYGAGPRFAGRAVAESEGEIGLIVQAELLEIITVYGWAT